MLRLLAVVLFGLTTFGSIASIDTALVKSLEDEIYRSPEAVIEQIRQQLDQSQLSSEMQLELQVLLAEAYLVTGDTSRSLALAKTITLQASALGDQHLQAKGLHRQASAQLYLGDYQASLTLYQQAHSIFERLDDAYMNANSLMGIGNVYGQLGELEQALNYYLRSLKLMQQLDDQKVIGGLYNNIGSIQFWLKDYSAAIKYYQRSLEHAKSINDTKQSAVQYANIGEAYTELKDYEAALKNFEIALTYSDATSSPYSKIAIHLPLGRLKLELGKLDEAQVQFDAVIELAKKSDAQDWLVEALLGKAATFQIEESVEAVSVAQQALELSEKINKPVTTIEAHKLLAKSYAQQQNYKQAFKHIETYHHLNDKLIEQDRQSEILQISAALELEQKNHQIALLEKDKIFQAARLSEEQTRNKIFIASVFLLLITLFTFYRHHIHRRQANKERQVADQLRRLDKLKDQFLANTSHELRTPLNAIIGLSQVILSEGVKQYPPDELDEILQLIQKSGEDLLLMVNDILDYSAIRENKLRVNIEPVALKNVVDKLLRELNLSQINQGVSIDTQVTDSLPNVKADPQRLYQILLNLIDNAIKFTPQGKITVSSNQVGSKICIAVEDTGIGIPADKIDSIFNRFEQLDGSSRRQFNGTGLGLAIVKELVELHDGFIRVISAEGEGTRFEITLPIYQAS